MSPLEADDYLLKMLTSISVYSQYKCRRVHVYQHCSLNRCLLCQSSEREEGIRLEEELYMLSYTLVQLVIHNWSNVLSPSVNIAQRGRNNLLVYITIITTNNMPVTWSNLCDEPTIQLHICLLLYWYEYLRYIVKKWPHCLLLPSQSSLNRILNYSAMTWSEYFFHA